LEGVLKNQIENGDKDEPIPPPGIWATPMRDIVKAKKDRLAHPYRENALNKG
jgi:hypothetical protein